MNRKEFLAELDLALSSLPQEERRDALLYYNEYLDDAGAENEDEAIAQLDSIKEIAARLNAEFAIKEMEENPASPKKGLSAIWIVILAIFSAPITVPLAVGVLGIFLGVVVAAASVVIAFWAAAIGCIFGGLASIVLVFIAGVSPWTGVIALIGASIASVGLGILLLLVSLWVTIAFGKAVAALGRCILTWQDKKKAKKNPEPVSPAPIEEKPVYQDKDEHLWEEENEERNN